MTLWNNNLLINVPEIDAQHKKLIEAIDELMDACFKGQGKDKIEKTLRFVIDYTKKHFSDEEKLHIQNAYPEAAAHKQLHVGFITAITQLERDFKVEGATPGLSIKLNKVLMDWLIAHITVQDKKYANFIRKNA